MLAGLEAIAAAVRLQLEENIMANPNRKSDEGDPQLVRDPEEVNVDNSQDPLQSKPTTQQQEGQDEFSDPTEIDRNAPDSSRTAEPPPAL